MGPAVSWRRPTSEFCLDPLDCIYE
ncbi:MAG: hypothetical protein RIR81_338, partial [Actinomycetota bacterium]